MVHLIRCVRGRRASLGASGVGSSTGASSTTRPRVPEVAGHGARRRRGHLPRHKLPAPVPRRGPSSSSAHPPLRSSGPPPAPEPFSPHCPHPRPAGGLDNETKEIKSSLVPAPQAFFVLEGLSSPFLRLSLPTCPRAPPVRPPASRRRTPAFMSAASLGLGPQAHVLPLGPGRRERGGRRGADDTDTRTHARAVRGWRRLRACPHQRPDGKPPGPEPATTHPPFVVLFPRRVRYPEVGGRPSPRAPPDPPRTPARGERPTPSAARARPARTPIPNIAAPPTRDEQGVPGGAS